MEFKKFTSLENTYRQNLIEKVFIEGLERQAWIVTEKVHGANFSFWYNGKEFKVASRNQFVDGTFYNCQAVINRYEQKIKDWYGSHPCDEVVIYGELYGHGIQKEVVYGEKDFVAFEVVIDGVIQDKRTAVGVANEVGIPFVPLKRIGAFEDCLSVNNTFRSHLTPDGCTEENFAEGVVIEPAKPCWFKNGNRVYFKNKSEKFAEKKSVKEQKVAVGLSDIEHQLLEDVLQYNTTQRVSNVISKIGQVTDKDFPKILGLFLKDILEEYEKDSGVCVKKVAEENYKLWTKTLQSEVTKTVRGQFVKCLI